MRIFKFFFLFLVCGLVAAGGQASEKLTVFAAASMTDALRDAGKSFTEQTGVPVVFSFAGTGTLARQIEAGAPADVFVSADVSWMDYVAGRGAIQPESVTIISENELVLVGPSDAAAIEVTREALLARLEGGRLAMADPETVPAGRYAKAALEALDLWPVLSGRLAPMDNVRVALTAVVRGETSLGIVYRSDAVIEPRVKILAVFPQDSHPAIRYPAALVKGASDTAGGFLDFLTAEPAQAIFHERGFARVN